MRIDRRKFLECLGAVTVAPVLAGSRGGKRYVWINRWVRSGKLEKALRLLAKHLHKRGKLDLQEAFIDATFASAKKGGLAVGPTRRGKGTKIVAIAADNSLPLAIRSKALRRMRANSSKESSDTASSTSFPNV